MGGAARNDVIGFGRGVVGNVREFEGFRSGDGRESREGVDGLEDYKRHGDDEAVVVDPLAKLGGKIEKAEDGRS